MTVNVRKLKLSDYYIGYPELMQEYYGMTEKVTFEEFSRWMMGLSTNHQVYVIEFKNKVIGSYSLYFENKLYFKVGYLNDLIIESGYRNRGLGVYLTGLANYKAEKEGCKKIIINCNPSLISFFKRNCYHPQDVIRMHKLF